MIPLFTIAIIGYAAYRQKQREAEAIKGAEKLSSAEIIKLRDMKQSELGFSTILTPDVRKRIIANYDRVHGTRHSGGLWKKIKQFLVDLFWYAVSALVLAIIFVLMS